MPDYVPISDWAVGNPITFEQLNALLHNPVAMLQRAPGAPPWSALRMALLTNTADDTWRVPDGVSRVWIMLIGAGGGGGGGDSGPDDSDDGGSGAGGGSAGECLAISLPVTPGTEIPYRCGIGGWGGQPNQDGGPGTNTVFAGFQAHGGNPGTRGVQMSTPGTGGPAPRIWGIPGGNGGHGGNGFHRTFDGEMVEHQPTAGTGGTNPAALMPMGSPGAGGPLNGTGENGAGGGGGGGSSGLPCGHLIDGLPTPRHGGAGGAAGGGYGTNNGQPGGNGDPGCGGGGGGGGRDEGLGGTGGYGGNGFIILTY